MFEDFFENAHPTSKFDFGLSTPYPLCICTLDWAQHFCPSAFYGSDKQVSIILVSFFLSTFSRVQKVILLCFRHFSLCSTFLLSFTLELSVFKIVSKPVHVNGETFADKLYCHWSLCHCKRRFPCDG